MLFDIVIPIVTNGRISIKIKEITAHLKIKYLQGNIWSTLLNINHTLVRPLLKISLDNKLEAFQKTIFFDFRGLPFFLLLFLFICRTTLTNWPPKMKFFICLSLAQAQFISVDLSPPTNQAYRTAPLYISHFYIKNV